MGLDCALRLLVPKAMSISCEIEWYGEMIDSWMWKRMGMEQGAQPLRYGNAQLRRAWRVRSEDQHAKSIQVLTNPSGT